MNHGESELPDREKYTTIALRKAAIKQIPAPFYKKDHLFAPWLLKCDSKIVKYDMRGLHVWRALVSVPHTILSERDTWVSVLLSET
jgi:hypothetical protein